MKYGRKCRKKENETNTNTNTNPNTLGQKRKSLTSQIDMSSKWMFMRAELNEWRDLGLYRTVTLNELNEFVLFDWNQSELYWAWWKRASERMNGRMDDWKAAGATEMKSVKMKTTKSCTHHTVAHTASEQHNGKRRIRILSQLLTRHKHLNVHIFMCAQRTACPTYLCGYMLQCTSTYTHTDAHAFAHKRDGQGQRTSKRTRRRWRKESWTYCHGARSSWRYPQKSCMSHCHRMKCLKMSPLHTSCTTNHTPQSSRRIRICHIINSSRSPPAHLVLNSLM